ncbi:MAG TPA: FAD-linked oxidase C-terminal domain-containing protein [Thermoguttaceae bacterium]|nr:FAD-linked oxidase C-terminal domain-containing protein [Thermoguttaceae bacterium]
MEQLDVQSERIQGDLRGLVSGEVRCDDLFCQLYAGDGSIYEIRPLGVVRPRSTADVTATLQYAAEKNIPVHARGAGTGAAGGALGPGLILDFSRHLHRVVASGEDWVRAQSGVALERLNSHLRRGGRHFAPARSGRPVSTLGGAIAVNTGGSHWPRYGSTRRHVRRVQVVLADGHVIDAGREPLVDGKSNDPDPRKRELIDQLASALTTHSAMISRRGSDRPVDRCGYHVRGVLQSDSLDLAGLITGSEGTLGLVTEATVGTEPLSRHHAVALLLFDSLDRAIQAAPYIAARRPAACDLLDRRTLSLARDSDIRFHVLIPPQAEAVLVVEQDGENAEAVHEGLAQLVEEIHHRRRLAFGAREAFDQEEVDLFWALAARIQPALSRLEGSARPVPVIDDIAVPTESLSEFLVRSQNVLKRHHVTACLSGHVLTGQLDFQPFLDLGHPADVQKMRRITEELYDEVILLGGTISAHRGYGLVRTPFVQRQSGALYDVFREIKRIFDPGNVLNPGKIVEGRWSQFTRDLRPVPAVSRSKDVADEEGRPEELRDLVELQLNWDPARVAEPVDNCSGCGDCRTQSPPRRMCPLFRVAQAEEASPRAKANLIRGVLTGRLELGSLSTDEFKRIADLCFSCHMCRGECPSEVDIPRLIAEGKGAYVAAKGLRLADYAMTRLDRLVTVAGLMPRVANRVLRGRQMRWLLEKTLGIAQGRKLPPLARPSFLRRAAQRRLTKPRRQRELKVAYLVDTYVNHHDPELGEVLLAILKHHDVSVYVPPKQRPAGTTAIAYGDLDYARRLAQRNTAVFAEAVRQGYHVVTTEPAATLTLRREYLDLLDDDDARLVAENTSDACHYLWTLHTKGQLLLDLNPIHATIAYHLPCRLAAQGVGAPGENLLRLIPGLSVQRIDAGCSGMGGTFGLRARNYRTSLRIGWGLIAALRDPRIHAGATECSTCKMQMEQGTVKPTIHPIKLLALAYGLMPERNAILTTPGKELLTT